MFLKSALIYACFLVSAVLANRKENGECGAVIKETAHSVKSASATFKLPTLNEKGNGTLAIFLGIDNPEGGGCTNSLWGAIVLKEGTSTYSANGQFVTDANPTPLKGVSFAAGEEVTVTVTAHDATEGTIYFNSHALSLKTKASAPLCQSGAFFALSAAPTDKTYTNFYPIAKLGSFTYHNAKITTSSGTKLIKNSASADLVDMTLKGRTVFTTKLQEGTVTFMQH